MANRLPQKLKRPDCALTTRRSGLTTEAKGGLLMAELNSTATDITKRSAADQARIAAEALEEALEALEALRPLFANEVEDARFSVFGALSLVEQIQAALPAPCDKTSRRDMEKGA
jgi:hypothetical protein